MSEAPALAFSIHPSSILANCLDPNRLPHKNRDTADLPTSTSAIGHRDEHRKVVGGLIEAKARLHSHVVKAVTVGDLAQLYTDFEGTMNDDLGKTIAIRHKAIEVLRRQLDGTWKLIVGDPNGRE